MVELEVPVLELWIIDAEGRKVVEIGAFRALIGSSSRDCDLQAVALGRVSRRLAGRTPRAGEKCRAVRRESRTLRRENL